MDRWWTILLIEPEDGLCVGSGAIAMPAALERCAESLVIVYLTIVNEVEGAIVRVHRLMPAGDIDDAQPTMS